jgi:nucleoside-diphosphate-sugar epimerase
VDVTHVDDAARAHLNAFDHLDAAAGKAFFIRSETVDLWPWLNTFLKRAGLSPITGKVGVGTAYRAGAVLEAIWRVLRLGGEPPMTRFVACNLASPHWFDISAAQRDLGYQPRFTAEDAVNDFLKSAEAKAETTNLHQSPRINGNEPQLVRVDS